MTVFNAYSNYYNLLYRDKDYAGEARYIYELIQANSPTARDILDLGCGTGRHDFELAGLGYNVTGVDMSEEMLAVARTFVPHPSPLTAQQPCFHQGDVRTARLDRTFDVVVSLFHVMSYQTTNDDLAAAFATARAHLKPGGTFLFDCWYGPAVLTDRPAVRVKRLEDESICVTRLAEPELFPNENRVDVNYQVMIRDKKSGVVEEIRECHRMRYLFLPELQLLASQSGLSLESCVEFMTGKPTGFDTWGALCVAKGR